MTQSGHRRAPFWPLPVCRLDPLRYVVSKLGGGMRRRDFISMLGGATSTWPLRAHAQQNPVIGFVSSLAPRDLNFVMPAFHEGLNDAGFVEGRNVSIEYRWAEGI